MDYVILPVLILLVATAYLIYRAYAARLRPMRKPTRHEPD